MKKQVIALTLAWALCAQAHLTVAQDDGANYKRLIVSDVILLQDKKNDRYNVLITVRNENGTKCIDSIRASLVSGAEVVEKVIGALAPGQESIVDFGNVEEAGRSRKYVVRFDYEVTGIANTNVVPIGVNAESEGKSRSETVVPAVLSIASLVIGAVLTHFLTMWREAAKEKLVWRKERIREENDKYRTFLAAWGRAPMPDHLKREFERLRGELVIPPDIQKRYDNTLAKLNDRTCDLKCRNQACSELETCIATYLMSKDPFE